ncbi:MAG: CvpA family protein [Pelagibacteraceae bacterium]
MDDLIKFFEGSISLLDLIFILFISINLISGLRNGLIGSLASFSKWVIAFLAVKYLLPVLRPYADGLISSKFMTDIILGSLIFFISLFLILLIGKGLKKTIKWSGLGTIDTVFGLIFGTIKGYIYFVTLFTIINLIHPYNRWSDSLNRGISFDTIKWGNELLIDTFPKRYEYIEKSKDKLDKFK